MLGSVGWIASPSDSSKLAAIGSVGELIIEGSVVTRGYLDDPEKTAAAYIDRPVWLQAFRETFGTEGASGRLYKTGDLVQYNTDGTLRYIGRKDTQVKRMQTLLLLFSQSPCPKFPPRQFFERAFASETSPRGVTLRNEK
jgi:acyl-CoA synthetase (AMP-forming)/AMP-acid ligase II